MLLDRLKSYDSCLDWFEVHLSSDMLQVLQFTSATTCDTLVSSMSCKTVSIREEEVFLILYKFRIQQSPRPARSGAVLWPGL